MYSGYKAPSVQRSGFSRFKFISELKELGPEAVRRELLRRRWSPEQLSVARQWLDEQDALRWDETVPERPPKSTRKVKILTYIIFAVGIVYALVRLTRRLL
jgi:hypothetical protein